MKKAKIRLVARFCLVLTLCFGCLFASDSRVHAATRCYAVYMSGHHDMILLRTSQRTVVSVEVRGIVDGKIHVVECGYQDIDYRCTLCAFEKRERVNYIENYYFRY